MKVLFEERQGTHGTRLGIVTLNAPQALNALSEAMVLTLHEQLHKWATNPDIVCILLRGEGPRAFSAGADVRSLAQACFEHPQEVPPLAARFFEAEYRLAYQIHTFPKPIIGWGHGLVLGGGMGLFQATAVRIVTPQSQLAMPEISIGLYPDAGASWFLSRLPGKLGLFLGLTGSRLNARDSLDLGLADRLMQQNQLPDLIDGLLQLNWRYQPERQLQSLLRALADQASTAGPDAQLCPRRREIDTLLDTPDAHSAWTALCDLESSDDPYLRDAARTLKQGAPVTAHLVWEQAKQARHLSLAQCFRMEYTLSTNCCRHPEFAEGVRARLLDKDNQPKWHWPDIEAVPPAVVQAHFQPTWTGPHPLADLLDHWR